jgi:hypothetical protein
MPYIWLWLSPITEKFIVLEGSGRLSGLRMTSTGPDDLLMPPGKISGGNNDMAVSPVTEAMELLMKLRRVVFMFRGYKLLRNYQTYQKFNKERKTHFNRKESEGGTRDQKSEHI